MKVEFILYVEDQSRSKEFYKSFLQMKPLLDVPGMTEFLLTADCKLGIMPNTGIQKILNDTVPNPSLGNGIPRCELYLIIDNPEDYMQWGLQAGAKLIDEMKDRDWGDRVGYLADPDGHIIAVAEKMRN